MAEQARLAAIHRYPVKGFGAQAMRKAELVVGRGLPHDRFLAIDNGHSVVPSQGWAPCQSFVRLTQNGNLPLYDLRFDEDHMTLALGAPGGETIEIDWAEDGSLDAANELVASMFPAGRVHAPRLVRRDADLGWWDCDDAPLSIINLATVHALAQRADQPIDVRQFRGNLVIDSLPAWGEAAWLGRRIRIGEAEIEVLRPIERCKATSVDVDTAEVRLNVPALLAGGEGHLFCGVYARVVRAGCVSPGDAMTVLRASPQALRDGAANPGAPEPARWPRQATLVRKDADCAQVTSYWLRDPLAGLRAPVRPGQHLRVHLPGYSAAPQWRSYTVSAVDGDLLRLSVKNEGGPASTSRLMHEGLAVGDALLISGPFGSFHLGDPSPRPLILVSAGIGITPTAAMLRALAVRSDRGRPVHVLHGARQGGSLALWPEVLTQVGRLPSARATLFLSQAKAAGSMAGAAGVPTGRIDARALQSLPLADAEVFVCGPGTFASEIRRGLVAAGAAPGAIHSEVFASPSAARAPARPAPLPGPFKVRLAASEVSLHWNHTKGSLLDAAEAAGALLAANCRAGVCGACRQQVASGTVFHLAEAPFPLGPHEVLTCCAVPTSDVTLLA
jgi:ferredoxin-NADP reductase/uncharacterized protein YcbX